MGIPYNFLQELSGVGRTIAPPEFDDSSRYIGTIQQFNYFYASESGTLTLNLNSFEKVFAKFDSDPYFNKMHGKKKDEIENQQKKIIDIL